MGDHQVEWGEGGVDLCENSDIFIFNKLFVLASEIEIEFGNLKIKLI